MIGFMIELTLVLLIVLPITMLAGRIVLDFFGIVDETEGCRAAREKLEHEEYRREEEAASEKRKAAWLAKYPNYVTKKEVKLTPVPVTQVKSTSMTDQQFYDKFGIWPDEMGEHPYNPPTR